MTADTWIVIVADGDSPGVPRRDFRRVGDRPLISWAIGAAVEVVEPDHIVVVSDDSEVEELAIYAGVGVARVSASTAAQHLAPFGAAIGATVLELRSSWPFISGETLRRALMVLDDGAAAVVSVTTESRQLWKQGPDGWAPDAAPALVEQAAVRGHRLGSSESTPIGFVELTGPEALEIRGFDDLEAARHWVQRLSVVVRTDAARELGMGHVYRSLALAYELAPHRQLIVTSADKPLGGQFFDRSPFAHVSVEDDSAFLEQVTRADADLVILDMLDTDADLIQRIRDARPGVRVVSFEDHGTGSHVVDLLVCDIYENADVPYDRQLVGITHALLSPAFETVPRTTREPHDVTEVLILFGGTDPSGLAVKSLRALQAIDYRGHVTVVRGLGADPLDISGFDLDAELRTDVANMAALMSTADLALSSAGRTLAELASIGVPTLCLAQNAKELRHTHSTLEHGVVMLGLGADVEDGVLEASLSSLIDDRERRRALRAAGLAVTRDRRNATVVDEILRRAGAGRRAL